MIYERCTPHTTSATDGVAPAVDPSTTGVGLTTTECQRGDPQMGVKPGVGMRQVGMQNAPQARMGGTCVGHGHGGDNNVMTLVSQACLNLQTPESARRFVGTGSVFCSFSRHGDIGYIGYMAQRQRV